MVFIVLVVIFSSFMVFSGVVTIEPPHNMCGGYNDGLKCEAVAADNYCKARGYEGYVDGTMVCDGGTHVRGNWANGCGAPNIEGADTENPLYFCCGETGSSEWVDSMSCREQAVQGCCSCWFGTACRNTLWDCNSMTCSDYDENAWCENGICVNRCEAQYTGGGNCEITENNCLEGTTAVPIPAGVHSCDCQCLENLPAFCSGEEISDEIFNLAQTVFYDFESVQSPCFVLKDTVKVFDCQGYSIQGSGSGTALTLETLGQFSNLQIKNCEFYGVDQAIGSKALRLNGAEISDNIFETNNYAINLTGGISSTSIKNNDFIGTGDKIWLGHSSLYESSLKNVDIFDNTNVGDISYSIGLTALQKLENCDIYNNTIKGSIEIIHESNEKPTTLATRNKIMGNVIEGIVKVSGNAKYTLVYDNELRDGIQIASQYTEVIKNKISNANGDCIEILSGDHYSILNNSLTEKCGGDGISDARSSSHSEDKINYNLITKFTDKAVEFLGSGVLNIKRNYWGKLTYLQIRSNLYDVNHLDFCPYWDDYFDDVECPTDLNCATLGGTCCDAFGYSCQGSIIDIATDCPTTCCLSYQCVQQEYSLVLEPADATINKGATQLYEVKDQDGNSITGAVLTAENDTIVSINGYTVTAEEIGETKIYAEYNSEFGVADLTVVPVTAHECSSLDVKPDSESVLPGESLTFTANLFYSDAPNVGIDITNSVDFFSLNPAVMGVVDNVGTATMREGEVDIIGKYVCGMKILQDKSHITVADSAQLVCRDNCCDAGYCLPENIIPDRVCSEDSNKICCTTTCTPDIQDPETNCEIKKAFWSDVNGAVYDGNDVSASEGSTVYLTLKGKDSECNGARVNLDYYEHNLIGSDIISNNADYNLPDYVFFPQNDISVSKPVVTVYFDPGDNWINGGAIPKISFRARTTKGDKNSLNALYIIPTNTPPGTCQITDYYWTNKSDGTKVSGDIRVNHDTKVYLVVKGSNCAGQNGTLQYWDHDGKLFGVDIVQTISNPNNYELPTSFRFGSSENKVVKAYDAQWYYADAWPAPHNGPEYVFKVTVGGTQTNEYSNELKVDKLGDCTDDPTWICCDASESCDDEHTGYYCSGGNRCGDSCTSGGEDDDDDSSFVDHGDGTGTRQIQSNCVDDGDGDNIGTYTITYKTFNITNPDQIINTREEKDLPCFLDQDIPFFDSFGIVFVLSILVGFYLYKKKKI